MFKAQASIVAALALLVTASASADMVTFWKTTQCPDFGGKLALARQVGTMEAPVVLELNRIISTGGAYCNLDVTEDTRSLPQKNRSVTNANISTSPSPQFDAWDCVVCQYPNKVIFLGAAMPAVSITALAFLGGGLAMLGLARLRRRQAQTTG